MKKKFLALTLALCMSLVLLAGCGGGDQGGTNTGSNSASGGNEGGDDTVYTFNIDFPNPETACGFKALTDWSNYISEESNGRLEMKIYSGGALGSLMDCVTNCESGVTDGFWSGVTLYPGVFPVTEVLNLPMIGCKNQYVMNAVMNDMLVNDEAVAAEWSKFKVVALHSSPPGVMLSSKPVTNVPDDWAGLNLRLSNAYSADWMTKLGINPVSVGINDGYENISKSVIDGGIFFMDQVESSALYEVIDNIYVGETVWPLNMFCLNKDKYDALPDDLKAIIDGSSEYFIERIAYYFDEQVEYLYGKFEEYDVKVIDPTPEIEDALRAQTGDAWQMWVDAMNEKGYDGQAILDSALSYLEKHNAEYE